MTTENELIAEFMGGVKKIVGKTPGIGHGYKEGTELWYGLFDDPGPLLYLEFDGDWSWLMPVIEKIHKIQPQAFKIDLFTGPLSPLAKLQIYDPIETVYKAVVEFIKWHNAQIKQP